MLPQNVIDEVLNRADIVDVISSYINVIKKGRNYTAICPFHDDKNPSMMISKDKQIFKCFVCGTGGNAITFIQKFENISYDDAVRKLAELVGYTNDALIKDKRSAKIDEENERLYNTLADLTSFYQMSLLAKEGEEGRNYLKDRNIKDDVIKHFNIGYCPNNPNLSIQYLSAKNHSLKDIETVGVAGHSNGQYIDKNFGRVIFPLKDINGRVIGYSARRIKNSDEAKYVNTQETVLFQKGNIIYNYHEAKKTSRLDGYCYVLEGFMDVIALYRAGIKSAVALMGTALTNNQVSLLKRLNVEIRLCLDSDNPGQMATLKAIEMFDKAGIKYRIVRRSTGPKDADEILEKFGDDKLIKWLNILIDKVQFALNYFSSTNSLATIDERKKFIIDFLPFLKNVNNELELEDYIVNIAKLTKFDRKIIANTLERYKKHRDDAITTSFVDIHPERKILRRLQLTEKAFVYQMLNSKDAINFYNDKNVPFTDEIFAKLASYLVDYNRNHEALNLSEIISAISQSDDELKDKIIAEVTDLSLEKRYPICSIELLNEYLQIINEERAKEYDRFIFEKSSEGKSEKEKLQILLEHNRKKNERLNKVKKGEN
ncbi:MAG: DNA primase [Erysipelotrichales bacterium]|nr:DNA primase [Erysipelotrichales bacterium]